MIEVWERYYFWCTCGHYWEVINLANKSEEFLCSCINCKKLIQSGESDLVDNLLEPEFFKRMHGANRAFGG